MLSSSQANACLSNTRKQHWKDYLTLCKPRVVLLMLLTSFVGMHLATTTFVAFHILFFGTLGIALAASGAAVINHLVDAHIDAMMNRTKKRPIPAGKIERHHAIWFSVILCSSGMLILYFFINPLTAYLTLLTVVGYAFFYSMFLKHATPQNIVIGGIAGAAPPLLGWTAVTNHISANALLLVLIIFAWTPPHFWALAIHRYDEYKKANIPMLPVTHGIRFTKLSILLYTILLTVVTLLPYVTAMSGIIYAIGALFLGLGFIYHAVSLMKNQTNRLAINTFHYSIIYLSLLFVLLLTDHYL